jgi:hypothetical protein
VIFYSHFENFLTETEKHFEKIRKFFAQKTIKKAFCIFCTFPNICAKIISGFHKFLYFSPTNEASRFFLIAGQVDVHCPEQKKNKTITRGRMRERMSESESESMSKSMSMSMSMRTNVIYTHPTLSRP